MIKRTDRHEKKIEILLDKDQHYWLVLKHSATFGICEECGIQKNSNNHKCSLDVIKAKNMTIINNEQFLTWDEQYKNVVDNMQQKKTHLYIRICWCW